MFRSIREEWEESGKKNRGMEWFRGGAVMGEKEHSMFGKS